MRNDAARGWKKVFGFTFTQYVRTKSFIVGTIIVCLITILLVGGLNIIPKLMGDSITGSGNSDEPPALDSVYLIDDSGLLTSEDTDKLTSAGVKLTSTDKTASELIDQLTDADAGKVLVTIFGAWLHGKDLLFARHRRNLRGYAYRHGFRPCDLPQHDKRRSVPG